MRAMSNKSRTIHSVSGSLFTTHDLNYLSVLKPFADPWTLSIYLLVKSSRQFTILHIPIQPNRDPYGKQSGHRIVHTLRTQKKCLFGEVVLSELLWGKAQAKDNEVYRGTWMKSPRKWGVDWLSSLSKYYIYIFVSHTERSFGSLMMGESGWNIFVVWTIDGVLYGSAADHIVG